MEQPVQVITATVNAAIDESIKAKLRDPRYGKNKSAIMKIDTGRQAVVLEGSYEDIALDHLRDKLPKQESRFIVYFYEYTFENGNIRLEMYLIFYGPCGATAMDHFKYASAVNGLANEIRASKIFTIENVEDLTEDWLKKQLSLFSDH